MPTILLSAIGSGQNALGALHGKPDFMQESTHVARMIMDPELLLEDPGNHGRGPNSCVQTVSYRTAVQNIAKLLPLLTRQLSGSSGALSLQQAFNTVLLIARQPFGNFGTRRLQNFCQLSTSPPLRVQKYGLQAFRHPISPISLRFLAQPKQPLVSTSMQTQDSWKHAIPPEQSMACLSCLCPSIYARMYSRR